MPQITINLTDTELAGISAAREGSEHETDEAYVEFVMKGAASSYQRLTRERLIEKMRELPEEAIADVAVVIEAKREEGKPRGDREVPVVEIPVEKKKDEIDD
jgi:hypothetical protein